MLTITSKDNANIKKAVKLRKSAKYRRETNLFIAEGLRVCTDAMLSNAFIDTVFLTEKALEKHTDSCEKLCEYADKAFILTESLFSYICDTDSPQGVLCIIKALDKINQFDTIKNGGKFLALENLQDPNNLGTVLRTAEAFGISGIVFSKDCCDIYNPKVVRGSMGAVFRLPFVVCESIPEYLSQNPELTSFAAVVDKTADKITDTEFSQPCIAVIGNEGNGLQQDTILACNKKITIPMDGRAESLNASIAASIIIWEMIK